MASCEPHSGINYYYIHICLDKRPARRLVSGLAPNASLRLSPALPAAAATFAGGSRQNYIFDFEIWR